MGSLLSHLPAIVAEASINLGTCFARRCEVKSGFKRDALGLSNLPLKFQSSLRIWYNLSMWPSLNSAEFGHKSTQFIERMREEALTNIDSPQQLSVNPVLHIVEKSYGILN